MILAFGGSLRKNSSTAALVRAAAATCPRLAIASIDSLPLFNQDLEGVLPPPVAHLRQQALSSSAFLFSTPEYNGFTSGALKNALDWLSRPSVEGASPLKGKPYAVVSAGGGGGGIRGANNISAMCDMFKVSRVGAPGGIAVKL